MAIRKYALVVFDVNDNIIDRFNIMIPTQAQGNGFVLNLSTINTDVEDIITKVVQQKNKIKFNVVFDKNGYNNANALMGWIQKYSKPEYALAIEYNDTTSLKYCEGKVTSLGKTERDEYGMLTQPLEFTSVTPFFRRIQSKLTIATGAVGKKYPYKYPYQYGAAQISNNIINNPYINDIPLIITINGSIANPTVSLLDESGTTYNTVKFTNVSLVSGDKIVINSAQRKIYKITSTGTTTDYSMETDPSYDTFLRAETGRSSVSVNTSDASDGFSLVGGWREYTL